MKTLKYISIIKWQKLAFVFLLSFFFGATNLSSQSYGGEFDIAVKNYNFFINKKDYDKAQEQARNAYEFALKARNVNEARAYALNLEANAYLKMTKRASKKRKAAKELLEESLILLAKSNNNRLKIDNYEMLKTIAIKDDDNASAHIYGEKIKDMSLLNSKNIEEKKLTKQNEVLASNKRLLESQLKNLNNDVSDLSSAKDVSDSLFFEQKMVSDSLFSKVKWDSILMVQQENAILQQQNQLDLQQSQLSLQKSQRNFSFALAGIITLLFIGMVLRYFETSKHNAVLQTKNELIEAERERSEELLLNILPSLIANELKTSGNAKARSYKNASVMFTDFVKFGAVAQTLKPEELVGVLDFYFTSFDEIISKYKVEKIKTIGDSYMLASGLPQEDPNNPFEIVKAAIDIQNFVSKSKVDRKKKNLPFFDARVGVHTGPLVAGVVGHKKFAYDIWGDTVNVASRLETNCEPGRVNISASTHEIIKNKYKCKFRGMIPVKNRDDVGMYYIEV
jgi:class 3 adenylate cyclase